MGHTGSPPAHIRDKETSRSETAQLSRQWAAVQDAAAAIAMLACLPPEKNQPKARAFPALIQDVEGARLKLARAMVDDMAAMLQPGLAALLAVNARGNDATNAAIALWGEYAAARTALFTLLPDTAGPNALGPRRRA